VSLLSGSESSCDVASSSSSGNQPQPIVWKWKDGPNYTVSNNGLTITKSDNSNIFGSQTVTALAQQTIDVSKKGKHSWKVRIDKGFNMIGVANSLLNQNTPNNFNNGVGWYFYINNSTVFHSGPIQPYPYPLTKPNLPIGTIVGVELDLDKRELSFSVNGVSKGVAVRDFPLDKFPTLTLSCCFWNLSSSVTIVE